MVVGIDLWYKKALVTVCVIKEQLEVKEKNLQHFFRKMGNGQKANFFLFEAKSLGLFKCISLLIKYYMFNEKCHFESSWIV